MTDPKYGPDAGEEGPRSDPGALVFSARLNHDSSPLPSPPSTRRTADASSPPPPTRRMSGPGFRSPPGDRWLEDYEPGTTHEFGSIRVETDEVLAFGRRFDPQTFHTGEDTARETEYGGLIASGWHTAALMMRLYADHYLSRVATLVSPGVDELRWLLPVRPGDDLSIRVAVLEARPSRSRPDRGIVRSAVEVLNQRGETVMTLTAINFMLRRPEALTRPWSRPPLPSSGSHEA